MLLLFLLFLYRVILEEAVSVDTCVGINLNLDYIGYSYYKKEFVFVFFGGYGRDVSSVFADWFFIGFKLFGIWGFLSCWDLLEFIEFFKLDDASVDATITITSITQHILGTV